MEIGWKSYFVKAGKFLTDVKGKKNSAGLSQWHTELSLAPLPRDLPNKTILGRNAGTSAQMLHAPARPGAANIGHQGRRPEHCELPGCYGNNMIGSRTSFDSSTRT